MGPELPDDPGRRQRPRQDAPAAGNAEATLRFVKDALPAPENEDPEEYMYNHFKWSKHGDMEPRHDPGIFARLVDARASPWALWDEVRTIKIPTLVLRGETSRVLSREIADRMVREMADARLIEMPGTSHVLNVEDPENFNRIAGEFIRR
jgi:pimeloyl-ACP methyl ester carboxylesterase